MTRIVYARNALDNLERAFLFLAERDPDAAVAAAAQAVGATQRA